MAGICEEIISRPSVEECRKIAGNSTNNNVGDDVLQRQF